MYRILHCDKDTYITNKIIKSTRSVESRSIDANVGYAGTIDIFKLYNETTVSSGSSGVELTRGLLHFNLNPIRAITGSLLNISDPSFKCSLRLDDVYGGQTTPSNFKLVLYPLAKDFDEGKGSDVISYRDLDASNWVSASVLGGTVSTWVSGGCARGGTLGQTNVDYYHSGSLGSSVISFAMSQSFSSGQENLEIDVTPIISGVLTNQIPDYGFRLSFSLEEEQDSETRFVKRFYSRHSKNLFKHPRLIVRYDDTSFDNQLECYLNYSNSIGIHNTGISGRQNFFDGTSYVTGSNCLTVQLISSKSVTYWTSSYSTTHSQSINHLTSSYTYFSMSFSGSQKAIAGIYQTGSYVAPIFLSTGTPGLLNYLGSDASLKFEPIWKTSTGTFLASGSTVEFRFQNANNNVVPERNFVVNIFNLKREYSKNEYGSFRVFIQDYDTDLTSYQIPIEPKSEIYENMHWRLLNAQTKEVIVDFDFANNATRLSADGRGMYFFMNFSDFPVNQNYELEFLIREANNDYYVNNRGFRFKIKE